jgi:DNA-binding NarL/FixJ family response regulator
MKSNFASPAALPKCRRVLIVEDHAAVREMLAMLLRLLPGFEVVGEAGSIGEATVQVRDLWPDIVVLDWIFPGGGGAEFLARLRRDAQHTHVLVFSAATSPYAVREALTGGAKGFVEKGASLTVLAEALRAIAAGGVHFGPAAARTVDGLMRTEGYTTDSLTARERDVLGAMAEGLPSKAIAARLHVSLKTVNRYRAQIADKTGLRSIAQLTMHAARLGLIPSPGDGGEALGANSGPALTGASRVASK